MIRTDQTEESESSGSIRRTRVISAKRTDTGYRSDDDCEDDRDEEKRVCVCVCVRERERERECVCVCERESVCVCHCINVNRRSRSPSETMVLNHLWRVNQRRCSVMFRSRDAL